MFNDRIVYIERSLPITKLDSNGNTGFLDISVFSEDVEPIEGAQITIFFFEVSGIYMESAIETEVVSYFTDERGSAPLIELPVIGIADSPVKIADEYHMRVSAPGYYSVIVMNIQIFPDTTTSYNIRLNPVTDGESYIRYIIIPEK